MTKDLFCRVYVISIASSMIFSSINEIQKIRIPIKAENGKIVIVADSV
jgi:nitrate reductase NapAB chaperone NapD